MPRTYDSAPASRALRGGFGSQRSPDARNAPRWTAEAAVFAQRAMVDLAASAGMSMRAYLVAALGDTAKLDTLVLRISRTSSPRVAAVAAAILQHGARQAADASGCSPGQIATRIREKMRLHAGPAGALVTLQTLPAGERQLHPYDFGHTAPESPMRAVRTRGRLQRAMQSWQLERLGPLPPHAVVCPERAIARVATWRRAQKRPGAPPPLRLLRSVIYTACLPTCVSSSGDHFWMIALGRWATPLELLALFAIPTTSPLWRAVAALPDSAARRVNMAIGGAVHALDARRVLRQLLAHTQLPSPCRYASACSGIDTFAAALDSELGADGWRYVAASESDARTAALLVSAYGPRGLTTASVARDAADAAAALAAPPADLWVLTPPCQPFSRRNHSRSEAQLVAAAAELDAMLAYARAHAPRAIVVENVDEPDARSMISARLLSLRGYTWERVRLDARDHGLMARARCFWIGRLSACEQAA